MKKEPSSVSVPRRTEGKYNVFLLLAIPSGVASSMERAQAFAGAGTRVRDG